MLQRQASAGSLPPDHHHHHHHHHHHTHQGGQGGHLQGLHGLHHGGSYDDGGYKSDGEAYGGPHTSGNHMCYKNSNSDAALVHASMGHNGGGGGHPGGAGQRSSSVGRVRHHTGGHVCPPGGAGGGQRPIRSLSGQLVPMPDQHNSHGHGLHGRNGYLSDGEGYMIQNQRVSRSGKYGSQASSPRSDRHLALHQDDDMSDDDDEEDDDDDEDDDEEEEELEEDIIDDNIEAEIHMNDLKHDPHVGQVQVQQQQATSSSGSRQASQGFESQPKPPPPQPPQRDPSSSDLIVSYTAFQAEASATLPGGRSGKGIFFSKTTF